MTTNTIFVADGTAIQTPQNDMNFVVMGANTTVVSVGSDVIFAGSAHSTIIAAGLQTMPGYSGADTVVLSNVASSTADVLMGYGETVFAGAGRAVVTWTSGASDTLVTGSGDLQVLNNPTGRGISYTGGIASVQHTNIGDVVHTGAGATVHLYTSGTVA